MEQSYDYDIAVTFAGEDRKFVYEVVSRVKSSGFKVFYDQDEQVTLWGEELTEYFPKVYEERSRYAVMFVSRHYAAKHWTNLERRSVLVRALEQPTPYLLPVRLDSTQLPGVRTSVSFLDGQSIGSAGVAAAILQKLSGPSAEGGGRFNGYVPRNEGEVTILVGERPIGWEYMLFSYSLVSGVESIHEKYLDYRMGFAHAGDFVESDEVRGVINRELASIESMIENFATLFSTKVQDEAFDSAGGEAHIDRILHIANRYTSVYESFIDWTNRLRSYTTTSKPARSALEALSLFAQQPIERLRDFAYEYRDLADTFHTTASDENIRLNLTVKLELSNEVVINFNQKMDIYNKSY